MLLDPPRTAVLALHWQVNVIKPEGFFAAMLAEPVERSGVVGRAAAFHAAAREAGLPVVFTRFTIPGDEGQLVRNTGFMTAVGAHQEAFRPDAPGAALIPEMAALGPADAVFDNQKLSGLAGSDAADWLRGRGVDTLLVTGVATNLTVEQTARHATDLGFTVHVVADCVAAADPSVHEVSLANLDLATAGRVTAVGALAALRGEAPEVPEPVGAGAPLRPAALLGLRTVLYPAPDLAATTAWWAGYLGVEPYFNQPFYVGFEVGGYELGLLPDADPADGAVAYWGVESVAEAVAAAVAAGATVHTPATNVGEGIVTATVRAPDGTVVGLIHNPHFAA